MVEKLDFITPTLLAVLDLFLSRPMREFYEREVMKSTGVSKGSANKILRLLADKQFLTRERKGRMVFYKLSIEDPVAKQFKVLVNIYSLKELLARLRQYTRRIVIFGSCAQGTDTEQSDIDLFVLTTEAKPVREAISKFNRTIERKVAPIVASANELSSLKKNDRGLYENIERGITLWQVE